MRASIFFLFISCLNAAVIADIRLKLSAGDLLSADAIAADFCTSQPTSTECAAALSWLARGAQMLGRNSEAIGYVEAVKKILALRPAEDAFLRTALGAAIETEARALAATGTRDAALALLSRELKKATAYAIRARIQKTIHTLTLVGKPAPGLDSKWLGKPTLLFLWAHWCGDCKAQVDAVAKIRAKYGDRLNVVAPTTRYQSVPDVENPTEQQENDHIEAVWRESYAALGSMAHPIDHQMMLGYGVSSTPTLVVINAKGIVTSYTTSRLSFEQLDKLVR